jgi:hypothetical protein
MSRRDELMNALRDALKETDKEVAHRLADEALLKFIGDPAVSRMYNRIEKWYS